ncbi:hypothetical protein H6P81_020127 [Aristolochia fimbriata]|uniref:Transposase, Ptta/En/Spm, plant n=1 Tax=Aristolochia fimbriata TaxID=158543 RepID=A0AAV7DXL4_ARIFI|nr:hypothetical protein H6P81_020127 [Aristolochia fimbriata]
MMPLRKKRRCTVPIAPPVGTDGNAVLESGEISEVPPSTFPMVGSDDETQEMPIVEKHYVFRYDKYRLPVPDEVVKAACMKNLCQSVKKWKNKLKKKYDKKNEEEKKICGDQRLTQEEWDLLVKYWESEEVIESCKRNKVNRSHAQATHTLGSKSIARHYAEERKRLGDDFTVIGSYLSAHRKKDGTYHNTYTQEKCVEVEKIFHENQLQSSKDITDLPPVLDTVFGRHHGGFERGMGSGWSRRSHQYSGTLDARVEALSTQIQEKDKEMAEKIEQLKEARKE